MEAPSVGVPFIDYFLGLLAEHGYAVTFAFAFMENVFILGSFVPGETIVMAAGFVAGSEALNPFLVWVVAFSASFVSGNLSYYVGRRGGRALIKRVMERFHISEKRLLVAEAYFERHGRPTVFLSRWVAGIKNLVPAIAGMSRMPLLWFELYTLLGALVYTSLLVAAGYFLGENFTVILDIVRSTAWGALLLVAAVVAYTRFRLWRRRRRQALADEATAQMDVVISLDGPETSTEGASGGPQA